MRVLLIVLIIFGIVNSEFYKAAVIEYQHQNHEGFEANIKHNLLNYMGILNEIINKNQGMDLIVFPEATLVTQFEPYSKEDLIRHAALIPDVSSGTNPCDESPKVTSGYVKEISCASRKHKVYVSMDIIEKSESNELFNTNIVFDRQGKIVSRYRKMHMYDEKYISNSSKVIETFTTDFGVTFGVFICFDIFFNTSFQESLDKGIEHFIFPTYWFSELPYHGAIQTQFAWAYRNDKVLLVADANNASTASGGTGIYLGRSGSIASYLSASPNHKVLVAEIPKHPSATENAKAMEAAKLHKNYIHVREDLQNFNFTKSKHEMKSYQLDNFLPNSDIEEVWCYEGFCCSLNINVNDTTGLTFRIYAGKQDFGGFGLLGVEVCVLVQCDHKNKDDCNSLPSNIHFNKQFNTLEVQVLNQTLGAAYYPSVSLQELYFLPSENFTLVDNELKLKLLKESTGIYTFGFFGRNYDIDTIVNSC